MSNPQARVIIGFGRNHVGLTEETYDYVVVDPPPPIESSGVSVISTLEFYRAAKARLIADGVMMHSQPAGVALCHRPVWRDVHASHVAAWRRAETATTSTSAIGHSPSKYSSPRDVVACRSAVW